MINPVPDTGWTLETCCPLGLGTLLRCQVLCSLSEILNSPGREQAFCGEKPRSGRTAEEPGAQLRPALCPPRFSFSSQELGSARSLPVRPGDGADVTTAFSSLPISITIASALFTRISGPLCCACKPACQGTAASATQVTEVLPFQGSRALLSLGPP